MPIRADKLREETPGRTSRGRYTSEQWEVWFDDGTGQYNENGLCDPQDIEGVASLPQYGNPHPKLAGAQVVDARVIQVIANWSYIVLVTYRGWGLYTGGPVGKIRSFSGQRDTIDIPIYQSLAGPGTSPTQYFYRPIPWPGGRPHRLRIFTRFLGGNQQDAVAQAIEDNIGGWYQIPPNSSRFFLLSDQSGALYDGTAYTRADYVFESWAPFPGASAGSILGNAVAIPPIGSLEVWATVYPVAGNPATPPSIVVVPRTVFAFSGGALPNFP